MEAIGHSWPEQDAVDAWIEEIEVPVADDERLALKKAVTKERLRQMKRAEEAESRVRELEAALVDIEKHCGWLRNDIRERDKVLCHELSIRYIIAQVHPQYARAALDGDGKKEGER